MVPISLATLLALLLPVLCVSTFVIDDGAVKVLPPDQLAAHMAAMVPRPGVVQNSELPERRYVGSAVAAMCDYSCASSLSIKENNGGGVYDMDLKYKPLKNVNSTMMVWLFQNLHKKIQVDGDVWPAYLIFHPIDHLHHEAIPADKPVGPGTVFTWNEITLTGCSYNRNSATEPWVCPKNRHGFVRGAEKSQWAGLHHTKVEMLVTRFDSGAMEFVRKEMNPFLGPEGRTVATCRHSWRDTPEGLVLRTQQWVGLMAPHASTSTYDTSLMAPVTNMVIREKYLDGATNVPKGNITAAGYMASLHFLQEYGSLPMWLPKAFSSNAVLE